MKFFNLLLAILFFQTIKVCSQVPTDYKWAAKNGSTGTDIGFGIATDNKNNVIVAGYYNDSITFGSSNLMSRGLEEVFVAKYDSNGAIQWAKSFGGTSNDGATAVATDVSGNIYIAVNSVSSFFYITNIDSITNQGSNDIFVIKIDPLGNVLWKKQFASAQNEKVSGLAYANNQLVLVGQFFTAINFDATALTSFGVNDIFITQLDTNGSVVWARDAGGGSDDYANAVAISTSGKIYLTGAFSSNPANFGTIQLSVSGLYDLFVASYDNQGTAIWAQNAVGTNFEEGKSIAVDKKDNCVVTGYFQSSSVQFGATTLNNQGQWDMFIARYNSTGSLKWASSYGGTGFDYGYGIATDGAGDILVTGGAGPITFGSTTLTPTTSGYENLFVTKIDTNGSVLWAMGASSPQYVWSQAVTTDSKWNVLLTGTYEKTTTFGTTTLTSAGGNEPYGEDLFVAKIQQNCPSPVPTADFTFVKTGLSINFTNTSSNEDNYLWDFGDSNTSTLPSPSHTYTADGSYNVCLTVSNCASNNQKCQNITVTAIDEIDFSNQFVIYPNPVTDNLIIKTQQTKSMLFELFDVTGKKLTAQNIKDNSQIDVTKLSQGIYFYRITTQDGKMARGKIIK